MATVSGRIVLLTLAGITAGLLTWLLSDISGFVHLPDTGGALTARQAGEQAFVCAFFGAMIGLMLGLADMLASGAEAQWARIVGIGLFVGAVAGFVGVQFGVVFYGLLHVENVSNPFAFLLNTLARALGWAFIGALAGAADGVRKWSGRTIRNGVVGGFIGGLLGGTVFEAAVYLFAWVPRPAVVSRLLGFLITGGLIGLFIGLVQQLLKEAWVRIVVGKNEGREVLIDKEQTSIGRSELCDIALFGDRGIEKNHALLIAAPTGGYVLRDVSGKPGTVLINGAAVQSGEQSPVRNGDTLVIGGKTLLFFERFTKERTVIAKDGERIPVRPPSPAIPVATVPQPLPVATLTAPRQPTFVATSGYYAGQSFPVRPGATIGRDPQADIALPQDTAASRRHAKIVQEALSLAIEDTSSTNGTFVNGQRVTRQSLVPGDTVLIGATALRLE